MGAFLSGQFQGFPRCGSLPAGLASLVTVTQPDPTRPDPTQPMILEPIAPVAYQVILEPGIGQFREFEPRRVHTRINLLGLFLVHKLTCGKRESVSWQKLGEKSTSSGIAESYAR